MSVAKAPAASKPGETPAAAPSFQAEVEKARVEPAQAPATETPAQDAAWDKDFDKWYKAQPPEAVEEFGKRYQASTNAWLEKEYGDLMPLVIEAHNDPEFRKELRRLVRDGKVDREAAEFVLRDGYDVWERTRTAEKPQMQTSLGDPKLSAEVAELRKELDTRKQGEQRQAYEQDIQRQYQALANEIPGVRFEKQDRSDPGYALAEHLIEVYDMKRRGGQNVTLKQVYDQYSATQRNREENTAPLHVAPQTSQPGAAANTQAPTDKVEAARRMKDQLTRAGGFRKLAENASARRRAS